MSQKLFKADDLIASGLAPSLPENRVPLWRDGRNVIFKEGAVQPIPGQTVLLNKAESAIGAGALELELDGRPNLFWGSMAKLYRFQENFSPADAEDVSGSSGPYAGVEDATSATRATRWSLAAFGNWVMAVNGYLVSPDPPQIWKAPGSGNPVGTDFADWDVDSVFTYAEIVRTIGPYAVVFNTSNGDRMIEWSHTDDPETWIPTATNAAGNIYVRGMDSPIICAEPLGKAQGFYSSGAMRVFEFIGAPFYFGVTALQEGIGAVGKDAVAVVGKLHYGFGPRGIFRTDGVTHEYIDDPWIHDHIYKNLNRLQMSKAITWNDASLGTVNFSYPSSGSDDNDSTVSFNYRGGTWSIFAYARTAATTGSVWDHIVTIDKYGNVYEHAIESAVPVGEGIPLALSGTYFARVAYGQAVYNQGMYQHTVDNA